MPATTHFPASHAQLRFINALRQERGLGELDDQTAALLTGGRNGSASRVITELQNQPVQAPSVRAATPRGVANASGRAVPSGTAVPTPRNTNRAGRMLNGGGIDATVTLPSGDHVTLLISTRVPRGRGWANGAPGDEGARTNIKVLGSRVGWINVVDGRWTVTLRTRNANVRDAVGALFAHAADLGEPGFRVQEASRCGRCRRSLTDPVSIDRGIGPECWGRCTGSHHAEVRTGGGNTVTDSEVLMAELDRIQDQADDAEQRYNREFAARERAQEEAAFASDPDYRAHQALNLAADAMTTTVARVAGHGDERTAAARDLIAAALKAYAEDELATQSETDAALAIFDRLARGVQS